MIRESEHFSFDGVKSTDFKIRNINISEGLYSEPLTSGRTINEVFIRGREEPYFIDVEEEPRTIQVRFFFEDGYNDRLIHRIIRWLNVKEYKPLFFSGDVDRVFYAMPVDGIEKVHNGLKEGYLELNMRCDSNRGYSHEIRTPIYNTSELPDDKFYELPIIKIGNRGHHSTFPKIRIEKIDDGDIVIYNKTNNNEKFEFKNVDVGEILYVDCENEIIETNKERTYRYDDFNDNYLELIFGENVLALSRNMEINFSYHYIFS